MTLPTASRVLAWDGCANVRDLGHLKAQDGRLTCYGALVRADDLSRLTKSGLDDAARHGINTVIDLRFPDEPSRLQDGRFEYVNLSLLDPNGATTSAIMASGDTQHTYRMIVDSCGERFVAVLNAVARATLGGVAIHCHAGRDRTGLVAAFILALAGVSDEAIASDYAMSDCTSSGEPPASPEAMRETLRYVRAAFGGIEAYLGQHGATAELFATLRMRLLAA